MDHRSRRNGGIIIGENSGRRFDNNPLSSLLVRLMMCVCCFIAVCFFISTYQKIEAENEVFDGLSDPPIPFIGDDKTPLVVLYHGKPDDAPYEWNTGVWPSWGERKINFCDNLYFF